jgi:CRISPR-associated protein Csx14
MSEASIPVDLFNPGQVFACLGFLEAAEVLLGDAEGGFDWSDNADIRFRLCANADGDPIGAVLMYIASANVQWRSPTSHISERDGGTTIVEDGVSASSTPSPADLPGRLTDGTHTLPFGYWADGSGRFRTSFKKSTNGASSYVRLDNALSAVREIMKTDPQQGTSRPFDMPWRTDSLFRLDPRGSTDPMQAGFSPDTLRKGKVDMRVATYPICETLAIIGLEYARPVQLSRESFTYCAWGRGSQERRRDVALLPAVLARAAVCGAISFLETRRFVVQHEEVKRGGDRKMTLITEETNQWLKK